MTERANLNNEPTVTSATAGPGAKNTLLKNKVEAQRDDVFNALYTYFQTYTKFPLTVEHQSLIKDAFKFKKVRRHQFLLQEGDVCKYICFVLSGALRIYSVNERGQEAVVAFALEGKWISDWESVVMQTPSRYYIDAIEHSEILQISPPELHALEAKIPAIDEFLRLEQRLVAVTTQKMDSYGHQHERRRKISGPA